MKDFIVKFLVKLFPEYMYWRRAKIIYTQRTGKKLNYRHPVELNEKLMWLTRYWRDPIKSRCADKYLVRSFVEEKGLGDLLIPLYGVYNTSSEIDYSKLPDSFVLKCNHGTGYNLFVNDKNSADIEKINVQLDEWLNTPFHYTLCEVHYKDIPPRIVCEEMISKDAPTEYQFWCIDGEPDSILACIKNHDGRYESWSYSVDWKHLSERVGENPDSELARPINLDVMLDYARTLSSGFPFVRVDFYEVEKKVFFAELTFSPCANVLHYYKDSFHKRLASKLNLSHVQK